MPSPGYTEHQYGPADAGFDVPTWRDPHLIVSGPAGVIFVTPLAGFTTAGKTLSITASADLDLAAQNALVAAAKDGIELFTVGKLAHADRPVDETGIRMAAASGPVTIQAQSDEARLAAQQNVDIASTTADVSVAAREHVLLTSQGAYLRLSGGNIEIHAPGNVAFHASQKVLTGPASTAAVLPVFPNGSAEIDNWIALDYRDEASGEGIPEAPYEIHFHDGPMLAGKLDSTGKAHHDNVGSKHVKKVVYRPREPERDKPAPALEALLK